MPGSSTTPGHMDTRAVAPIRVAFHIHDCVGPRDIKPYAAQWLAYALPYRRFADTLTGACARLGADADRYSFTVRDLHPLLLAGFAGALRKPLTYLAGRIHGRRTPGLLPKLLHCQGSSGSWPTREVKLAALWHGLVLQRSAQR